MTDASNTLQAKHELLHDGLNDGFRAPDLGWVKILGDEEIDPLIFDAGSLVFSNWWAGPREQARALADALIEDFSAYMPTMTPENEDDLPGVSVCYWEDPVSGLALVGQQSISQDFILGMAFPKSFKNSKALSKKLTLLAEDGNDNSPHTLVETISEQPKKKQKALLELVIKAAEPVLEDELREMFDEA